MHPTNHPDTARGWHSRGYLPHFDAGSEYTQGVTFRLYDSLPEPVLDGWRKELAAKPAPERESDLRRLLNEYLDQGHGSCFLDDATVAEVMEGALEFGDGSRYELHAWVIMPNHVHALFTPRKGWSLSRIVGDWKSFVAHEANKLLQRSGQFWHEDYFDRYIRDEIHFQNAIEYIAINPVKAGLCREPHEWRFGSAYWKWRNRVLLSEGPTPF